MKFYKSAIYATILLFYYLIGCTGEHSSPEVKLASIDISQLSEEIHHQLQSNSVTDTTSVYTNDSLGQIYAQLHFKPLWIKEIGDSLQLAKTIAYFLHSNEHGISPKRYGAAQLHKIFDSCWVYPQIQINYPLLAKLEIMLSKAFLNYQHDICFGVINPRDLDSDNYDIRRIKINCDPVKNLLSNTRFQTLEEIQPTNSRYINLQKALKFYTKLSDSTQWDTIRSIEGKIEKGNSSGLLPGIVNNLRVLGYIDTTYHLASDNKYDTTLLSVMKRYQSDYCLQADGTIGKATIEQLNISPKQRSLMIALNLERLRWNQYGDTGMYIMVNIPAYTLYGYHEGKQVKKIKVCVGQRREKNYTAKLARYKQTKKWNDRPKNFETPQVSSNVFQIITNPKWSVPTSIARNETYHEIMKDTNFLVEKHYKVFQNGKSIDPSTINWKKYSPSNLPFMFEQDPGAGNALGKIKFMFANKYSIYLHDTPTRPPFAAAVRAVSHGCVRVEKPLELVNFILSGNNSPDPDDILCELAIKPANADKIAKYNARIKAGRTPKTKYFSLSRPIPVIVDYFTSWADEDNKVHFSPDVYQKDIILARMLKLKGGI
ncbi:MAG: L,D-transpeptidase family protein [Ignavibacteria bacterium]|nr:L,D-transpeptidase family protein [Ignavibacteria bacterium]